MGRRSTWPIVGRISLRPTQVRLFPSSWFWCCLPTSFTAPIWCWIESTRPSTKRDYLETWTLWGLLYQPKKGSAWHLEWGKTWTLASAIILYLKYKSTIQTCLMSKGDMTALRRSGTCHLSSVKLKTSNTTTWARWWCMALTSWCASRTQTSLSKVITTRRGFGTCNWSSRNARGADAIILAKSTASFELSA